MAQIESEMVHHILDNLWDKLDWQRNDAEKEGCFIRQRRLEYQMAVIHQTRKELIKLEKAIEGRSCE